MTNANQLPSSHPEVPEWFSDEMDKLYESMQTPEAREGIDRAFHMSPADIAASLRRLKDITPKDDE